MGIFRGIDGYLGLLLFEIRRFEEEFHIPPERTEALKALVTEMLITEEEEEEITSGLRKDGKPVIWH
ncbi:MAG: hypothetical protein N2257_05400 [Thermodesulfovibrionales bacterium]|nr:hypothetical protein [Thermodesulfovibrionales bacterium]